MDLTGTFHVVESSPYCIRMRLTGRFTLARCHELTSVVDAWRGTRSGVSIFTDVSAVEDYDVAARERVTDWLRTHDAAFEGLHALVNGRTTAWALKIISALTGLMIVSHHSRVAFEATCLSLTNGKRA